MFYLLSPRKMYDKIGNPVYASWGQPPSGTGSGTLSGGSGRLFHYGKAEITNVTRDGTKVIVSLYMAGASSYNWNFQYPIGTKVLKNDDHNGNTKSKTITIEYECSGFFEDRIITVRFSANEQYQGTWYTKDFELHTGTLTPLYYAIVFDANGGYVSEGTKVIDYESPYGELPTPNRNGYRFLGWYTDPEAGELVSPTDVPIIQGDTIVLYAHWKRATSFRMYQNGSSELISTTYVKEGTEVSMISSLFIVENGQAYQGV